MDEKPKIDLQKHRLPPASRKYMIRIIIYVIFLSLMAVLIYKVSQNSSKAKPSIEVVNEIEGIQLDSVH